jgi:predicted Zn-dependent protease
VGAAAPLSQTDRKLFQIAIDKQAAGRKDDALVTALPVLARNPQHPMLAQLVCAMSLETKRVDPETVKRCTVAAALSPGDARPQLWLAWSLAETDATAARAAADEAAARLDRDKAAPELEADLINLYRRLGCPSCAQKRGAAPPAPPAAEKTDDRDAKFRDDFNAVVADLKAKRTVKAIERAYALTKAYPQAAGAWSLACEAQLAVSPGQARTACVRALQLDASSGRAHYLLAVLDEGAGKKVDAIGHLEKAVAGEPANDDAWQRLARLYRGFHMASALDAIAVKYKARFGKPLP